MPNFIKWYAEKGEGEKGRALHEKQKKRYYGKTAIYKRREWTMHEIERVFARDKTDFELSKEINRSVQSIQIKRSRLNKDMK